MNRSADNYGAQARDALLAQPLVGHRAQGVPAAQARPHHLRHGRRHADRPADPVRLRDQHRPQAPADRGGDRRTQRVHAQLSGGDEDQRLLRVRRRADERGSGARRAGARRRAVRRQLPRRLHPQAAARRASGAADRGRRHRPGRRRRGDRIGARARHLGGRAKTCKGALAPLAGGPRAVRGACAQALQPRGADAAQHRAGPDGRDPDDDDGDDDRPGDDARARARHDGEPARHAGAAAGGDDRQDRALHLHRFDPVDHHPAGGASTCSACRSSAA